MTPLAFYRDLIANGVPEDLAYRMAEKFEAERAAEVQAYVDQLLDRLAVDRKAEARRAKDRARKAAKARGIPRNSAESAESAENTRPLPSSPQTPQQPTPTREENTTSREKRGSRIPEGFNPDLAVAEALGLTLTEAAAEADRFLDYWRAVPGAKGRKLDWPATWRNWCRSASERKPTPRKAHERPHSDDKFDRRQANLARAFAASERVAGERWEP